MVSRLKCNTVEEFQRGLIGEASSWRTVVSMHQLSQFVVRDFGEIDFSWQGTTHSSDSIFDSAFLPGCMGIAEEGFDAEPVDELVVV